MAKQGSGRISGTLRPRYGSSFRVFEQRGDPAYTPRELDKEFPLRQSRPADTPTSPEQLRANEARYQMNRERLAAQIKSSKKLLARLIKEDLIAAVGSVQPPVLHEFKIASLIDDLAELEAKRGKEAVDSRPPQPRLVVDPDLDCFTKATRAVIKEPYHDIPGKAVEADHHRRAVAATLKMRNEIRKHKPVEAKPRTPAPRKVKGSFYRFDDVTEKLKDCDKHKGRPFFGKSTGEKK